MDKVRTTVVLPADLLQEIDRVAGERRRSAFLAEAAREKLERLRFDRAAADAFGAWADEDHPDLTTDADMERYLQASRSATNRRIQSELSRHE